MFSILVGILAMTAFSFICICGATALFEAFIAPASDEWDH